MAIRRSDGNKMANDIDSAWKSVIETRIIHMDDSFSKSINMLSQNQASMQSTLETAIRTLDNVSDRINRPQPVNWVGLVSAIVSIVVLMGAGVVMKVSPLEHALNRHETALDAANTLILDRAGAIGKFESAVIHLQEMDKESLTTIRTMYNAMHKQAEDIASLKASKLEHDDLVHVRNIQHD